jgi:glycosyltransferase involved in cell wall biosynthesis
MRVLYLLNSDQIGGGNRSLLELWRAGRQLGLAPAAISPASGPMEAACASAEVPVRVVPYVEPDWRRPVATARATWDWRRLIKIASVDVVHSNGFTPSRAVATAARLTRTPHVCHVRFGASAQFLAWVFHGLPVPDVFIFNSHALADDLVPHLRGAYGRIRHEVIHNGVNLEAFRAQPRRPGCPRIGIVANLIPVKGHADFLHMAARLKSEGVEAEYWIIGGDIHRTGLDQKLERLSCELGVAPDVRFLGHRNDVPDLVAQLDVLVCASHDEPFGRCLIEAMSCGKPVVATRVGGIPEVVEDGSSGLLVPARDPSALAAAVARLLRDPTLAAAMGRAGHQRAQACFDAHAHAARVGAVYETLRRRPLWARSARGAA